MKLESTLRFRPHLLYTIPVMDLLGLLLLFFLLTSSLVLPTGIRLELPPSSFALQGMADARVLVVSGGEEPRMILDGVEVDTVSIASHLREMARQDREERGRAAALIIMADRSTPHGLVVSLGDQALELGFRVALASLPQEEAVEQ